MPSLQSLLLFIAFILTFLHLSSATPILAKRPTDTRRNSDGSTPSIPSTGGATELPAPFTNLTLKHIAIGTGVQNYTCLSENSTAPKAVGALATLYDATTLAYTSPSTLRKITAMAVTQPLTSTLIYNYPLSIPNIGSFPIIGSHYFTADGTPTFDLVMYREIASCKKMADIPAPKGASEGPAGTGAVDWLALTDNGKGLSVGLREVYRVETAGGSPPSSCSGEYKGKVISVQYSAQYWFYG